MQQGTSVRSVDNATVRVTTWTLQPDEHTGPHRHELNYVVVPLTDGTARIVTAGGDTASSMRRGEPYYRDFGARHDLINDAAQALQFVEIELK